MPSDSRTWKANRYESRPRGWAERKWGPDERRRHRPRTGARGKKSSFLESRSRNSEKRGFVWEHGLEQVRAPLVCTRVRSL